MITIDDVVKEVSLNLNLDKDVVRIICRHPFEQTVQIMKSNDVADILYNQLFKFKLKKRYKEDKQKQYSK